MKVQISGPHTEVQSVFVDTPNPFMLSVFINMQRKDIDYPAKGWMAGIVTFEFDEDKVTIIPENEEESNLLSQAPYTRHCKNQLHYMYLDEKALNVYPKYIYDGCGESWSDICSNCKRRSMEIVRPGKVQCIYCG